MTSMTRYDASEGDIGIDIETIIFFEHTALTH